MPGQSQLFRFLIRTEKAASDLVQRIPTLTKIVSKAATPAAMLGAAVIPAVIHEVHAKNEADAKAAKEYLEKNGHPYTIER